MKKIIQEIIDYRYLIAIIAFIIGVSLNLHGSSISNWNNYGVREMHDGTLSSTKNHFGSDETVDIMANLKNWISLKPRKDGTIAGVPRMVRTDEWLVQTPYFISQAETGNKVKNPNYGLSGQNMIVSYNAPVKDISSIGKPFDWGFLLLGISRGLSWYWCFKVIALLLLAFEFSMILTNKNQWLSLVGSFWITFTPAIQWWFMQHLGDVVFYSLLSMVSIYHYFQAKSKKQKFLFATLLTSSLIGFPLVLYPAFQVPFAYVIAVFFIIQLISTWKEKKLKKFDWLMMLAVVVFTSLIVGITIFKSWDALKATLNTVYPGSRVSTGGEYSLFSISDFFLSFVLPFKIPKFSNQVELATGFHFIFVILFSLPFVIKREKIKENLFGIFLTFYSLLLMFFAIIGVPKLLAKLTLFSFVISSRAWQAASIIGVFASIWFTAYLWRERIKDKRKKLYLSLIAFSLIGLLTIFALQQSNFVGYMGTKYILMYVLFYTLLIITVVWHRQKMFMGIMMSMVIIGGMTVNPLVQGTNVIEDKKISLKIKSLVKKDKDARWVSEGFLYNFPQMFGAKSINGVRFYPDEALMKALDPTNKMENYWNRYSHTQIDLTEDVTSMTNESPDNLIVHLNVSALKNLKVKYIITNRSLEQLFGSHFQKIYGADKDGNMIYYYHY
ncbi:DUF7657 domain-containing protein [Streptococcus mutans]|uniref:DUF7657 domain-containing protein n=2 Tax=Streptococcus mutans TaxID=1309 RepID=UPI0002B4F81B|nr:hypothetical protein [Streptococcus mutans]EMB65934.1 hypothetical protein SMU26_05653 [Streptococcus mutans 3SN1]EMC06001.1 hypothetical protein SMU69_04435 [Streptococcus mutans NLML4]EMC19149.1 hypothetical protein SMU78_00930 [Streptococcus mutans W6]EMC35561.1 hypothetical protein SMU92_01527 [Streptococcus mutans 14D]EMC57534.1 hypothetical protein SMU108_04879 [Streptococcus mutans M230]